MTTAPATHSSLPATTPVSGPNPVALALGVSGAAALLWAVVLYAGMHLSAWETPQPEPTFNVILAASAPKPMLPLAAAAHGHEIFEATCAACHASSGMGKQGLGKSLVQSSFVLDNSDPALAAFIARGREVTDPLNTTKVPMPPKGGNATLTDADLADVVVYVRGLQDPRRLPVLPPIVAKPPAPPTEAEKAAALAAAGGDAELAAILASGSKLFASTCAACHGSNAKGLKGMGKDLTISEFVTKTNDDGLLAFIKKGRAPGEAGNTTGVAMPPKGGNPALSDDDLLDIIAHLRSLQTAAKAGATASANH